LLMRKNRLVSRLGDLHQEIKGLIVGNRQTTLIGAGVRYVE